MRKIILIFLSVLSSLAFAGGSTINTSIPAPNALISSAPIRSNFAAAYGDINNLIGQNNGGLPPLAPLLGQLWLNTSGTPYTLEEWDGNQWVASAYLNATTHTWATPSASLPLGTSVNNPGSGLLESLLPVQTEVQTSRTYSYADFFRKNRRANSGVAMSDMLPVSTATGLSNGTQINIANVDASAMLTLAAGSGTSVDGLSSITIPSGRDEWFAYDAVNATWRGVANTRTMVLFGGVPPTASQLFGGSGVAGQANAVSIGACINLAGGVLSDICGGTITGPAASVVGYLPSWNNTTGTALAAGVPYGTTGNNTIVETTSGGTISPGVLPNPSASTLGGVESATQPANQWMSGINTSGVPQFSQPAFSNLSGAAVCAQLPALTGSVVSNAASCTTSLNNTGVAAQSYSSANITVGADGRITAASNGIGGGYPSNFIVKTTSYTAAAGDNVLVDTSGGAFTITLPASPSQFNQICLHDAAGTFGSNALTIAGNGLNIMGSSANMTATTPYVGFCLIYYTSSTGWRIE